VPHARPGVALDRASPLLAAWLLAEPWLIARAFSASHAAHVAPFHRQHGTRCARQRRPGQPKASATSLAATCLRQQVAGHVGRVLTPRPWRGLESWRRSRKAGANPIALIRVWQRMPSAAAPPGRTGASGPARAALADAVGTRNAPGLNSALALLTLNDAAAEALGRERGHRRLATV